MEPRHGYIALNRLATDEGKGRYYTLVLNGQSLDLVRGAALVMTPTLTDLTDWEWDPDERDVHQGTCGR